MSVQIVNLPKINLPRAKNLILSIFILAAVFAGGYLVGSKGYKIDQIVDPGLSKVDRTLPLDKTNVNFTLFWKVWDTLSAKYFDQTKLNSQKMIYGAIEGMVAAIGDPYTSFLPPDENKVVNEDLSGSFEGVGIQIGYKGTQLAVIAPLPGSPADKAGVKAGDLIVGIKDEVKKIDRGTQGMSLTEAVQIIRGKAKTKVTIMLMREGNDSPIIVELTREKIEVPTIILSYVGEGNKYARIQLTKFGEETNVEWQKAIKEITGKAEVKGIILDLRNNPGGYLGQAVDVVSEFVKPGTTVVMEEHVDGVRKEYKTERTGILTQMPLVVLINGGSASASEITAGALRDLKKIKLVGDKSFGKGTIQEPIELTGGAGVHITIAKWLTPNATWVHGNGLDPDILIKDDPKTESDEQLNKAIEVLN